MTILVALMVGCAKTAIIKETATYSFSVKEIELAEEVAIPPIQFLESVDRIKLGYREYNPSHIKSILIFYHGGGAHSAAGYQHLGVGLRDDYGVLVISPDIRGHGQSGGRRGDAPNPEQVYKDVSSFIKYARKKYPNIPLYIGGHSSGAGLLVNYSSYTKKEKIDGYVFLSPYLGFRSKTEYLNSPNPFAKVKTNLFIKNAVYGLEGNTRAVFYNYPAELLEKDPRLITAITVNMANVQTPTAPAIQLNNMNNPF